MGGYDAVNLRYTRERNIATILNEMLKHLLYTKPKEPCDALLAYLQSEAGRQKLGLPLPDPQEVSEELVASPIKPVKAAQDGQDEIRDETEEAQVEAAYERGVGIRALLNGSRGKKANIDSLDECVQLPPVAPASPSARPRMATKEYDDLQQTLEARVHAPHARGAALKLLLVAGSRTSHALLRAMQNDFTTRTAQKQQAMTGRAGDVCKGAGLALLRSIGSSVVAALVEASSPAAPRAVPEYTKGAGVMLLRAAGSCAAQVLAAAAAPPAQPEARPGSGLALLRAAGSSATQARPADGFSSGAGLALLWATGAPPRVEYTPGAGLALLRKSSPASVAVAVLNLARQPAYTRGSGLALLKRVGPGRQGVAALSEALGGFARGAGLALLRQAGSKEVRALEAAQEKGEADVQHGKGVALLRQAGAARNGQMLRALDAVLQPSPRGVLVPYAGRKVPEVQYQCGTGLRLLHGAGSATAIVLQCSMHQAPPPRPQGGHFLVNEGLGAGGALVNGGVASGKSAPPAVKGGFSYTSVNEGVAADGKMVHGGVARHRPVKVAEDVYRSGRGLRLLNAARGHESPAMAALEKAT